MSKKLQHASISILVILCFCLSWLFYTNIGHTGNPIADSRFTQIIAFGDSYSDNGRAKIISTEIMNSSDRPKDAVIKPSGVLYWNNRYSNGITAVEILADKMKLPLVNYATGGATSGYRNYARWMDTLRETGVQGQIAEFEKTLDGNPADPDALYFIFASANDFFYFEDYYQPGNIEAVADEVVDNLKSAARKLSKLGAKNFFIVNCSDLSLVPFVISEGQTADAYTFVKYVNTRLPEALESLKDTLDINVLLFDLPAVSTDIIKNSYKYKLSVFEKPCQVTYPEPKPAKKNPDSYYFWDEWHYTRAVHKIIGERMYQEITSTK